VLLNKEVDGTLSHSPLYLNILTLVVFYVAYIANCVQTQRVTDRCLVCILN